MVHEMDSQIDSSLTPIVFPEIGFWRRFQNNRSVGNRFLFLLMTNDITHYALRMPAQPACTQRYNNQL